MRSQMKLQAIFMGILLTFFGSQGLADDSLIMNLGRLPVPNTGIMLN